MKADTRELQSLRALCRYQTHGGYVWAAVMDDGALLCVRCLREHYRLVFKATRDKLADGWQLEGVAHSGEFESTEYCEHCENVLWSKEP